MKNLFFFLTILFLISGCAKRGSPTGGPKDTIPPVLVNANPKLNSTFFDSDEIILTFDEWVKLDKVQEQLIISPPLERSSYEVKPLSGVTKKVFLKFLDSLNSETTYTINFGNSIKDNNEDNALTFFSYTFSTGAVIDSLYVRGEVKDAFNLDTDEYISIHLYRVDTLYNDSIIFNDRPTYVSNTLDSVAFQFQNLKEGKYLIIAMKDIDNNYFFDPYIDKIGFIDSLISLPRDSIIDFRLFKEDTEVIWDKPHLVNSEKIGFGYYGNLDTEKVEIVSILPDSVDYIFVKEKDLDTISLWISKNSLDTINFNLIELDTTKLAIIKFDRSKDSLIESLKFSKITENVIHFKEKFKLVSNKPIIEINEDYIFITDADSTQKSFVTKLGSNPMEIEIDFEIIPLDQFDISIFPNAFIDFNGRTNDTLKYSVVSESIDDYGNIFLDVIRNSNSKFILQLLDSNYKIVREFENVNQNNTYTFDLIRPGNYTFRLIEDLNENDKWDTGNFLKKIIPEPVYYYPKQLEVRPNWDLNEVFNLTITNSERDSIN